MADTLTPMYPSQRINIEVSDTPSILMAVTDAYDVDVDADGDWKLSDVPPSGEINIRSSLHVDSTVIRDKCVRYLVEAPRPSTGVSKLGLRELITLSDEGKILASVTRFYGTNWSSKAQVQLLRCQF